MANNLNAIDYFYLEITKFFRNTQKKNAINVDIYLLLH